MPSKYKPNPRSTADPAPFLWKPGVKSPRSSGLSKPLLTRPRTKSGLLCRLFGIEGGSGATRRVG